MVGFFKHALELFVEGLLVRIGNDMSLYLSSPKAALKLYRDLIRTVMPRSLARFWLTIMAWKAAPSLSLNLRSSSDSLRW